MMGDFPELLRRLQLDISSLANKLRTLFVHPLLAGRLVSFTLAAGSTTATATHGLGRAYLGGFVVGADTALALVLAPPGATSATTVTLSASVAPASPVTVSAWVF